MKDVANRLGAGESEETLLAEVQEEDREMCKAIKDLIEDGRIDGIAEERMRAIKNMIGKGYSEKQCLDLNYTKQEIEFVLTQV